MIKRTLYFGNPAYLSQRNEQLVINLPNAKGLDNLSGNTVPIEDIGVVILDHQQITITHSCINKLLKNNAAFIICDDAHLPAGMLLNLNGHTLQSSKFRCQTEATEPLKKQLWQQTIKAKIANQAAHLIFRGKNAGNLKRWSTEVKSGDPEKWKQGRLCITGNHFFTRSKISKGRAKAYRQIICSTMAMRCLGAPWPGR